MPAADFEKESSMEEVDKKRKKDEEETLPDVSGGVVTPGSDPIDVWDPDFPIGPTCPPFEPIVRNSIVD
jgi:hypothetical protein